MAVRIRPTDAINSAALVVLAFLTVLLRHRLADPAGLLWRYAALGASVALMAALARRFDRLSTPLRLLVDFLRRVEGAIDTEIQDRTPS